MTAKKRNQVTNNLVIEDAHIVFRNFSGKEARYNREGNRNFCVLLDDPDIWDAKSIEAMERDGWNIRYLKSKEPDESPIPYLQVKVSFDHFPSKVILITSHGQTPLNEDTVGMLDWSDILNVDLIIRPYNWEVNDKRGVKAYVKAMYVTIEEDEFADKYSLAYNQDSDVFDER